MNKWLPLGGEQTAEILNEKGITWTLQTPRELDIERVFVNPTRIRRLARVGGGLGHLTISGATLDNPTYVSGNVNASGAMSITNIQRKSRTNRGVIDREDHQTGQVYRKINSMFNRPSGIVDVDTSEIREILKNTGKDQDPKSWMKSIDKSIKDGVTDCSIMSNVIDPAFIPEVISHPMPLIKGVGVFLVGLKAFIAYKGIGSIVDGAASLNDFATYAGAVASENITQGVIGAGLLKFMFESDINYKDFKPSIVCPQLPIDRVLVSAGQQYLSSPVIQYQQ